MWGAKQDGIKEGLKQGVEKGERTLLLKQAKIKFGKLPAWSEDALEQAPEPKFQSLAESILTANTLETWLTQTSEA